MKIRIGIARSLFVLACAVLMSPMPGYSQGRDVTRFPGSDIGQQINAAYGALPPTGGKLHVPSRLDGNCYQFATPIHFNIPDKTVVLEGDSVQSTCLQFLGRGVAMQFDYGFHHAVFGAALRDLSLQGTAQQGTGLVLGGSNGAEGVLVENVRITGFGLGVTYSHHAWASRFAHAIIDDNVQNLYYPPDLLASGENAEFDHVLFLNSNTKFLNTDANVANSVVIDAGAGSPPDLNFVDCSFDGVQVVLTVGYINMVNPHFESGFGRNALDWIIVNGGAYVNIVNPMFLQDFFSGIQPSQLIRATGGLTVLSGVKAYTNQVIPRFMLLQGTANALVLGEINVQNFTADIVKDKGATGYFAVHGAYNLNLPLLVSNNAALAWQNKDGTPTEELRLDAYNSFVIHNPGASISFWNKDETAPIGGFSDGGLAVGTASISTSGDARFHSVTTSTQPAASVAASQPAASAAARHEEKNPPRRFNSLINFGVIPANTCKENGIPVAGANTNTSVAPVWPPLENGLTGIMYISESGKLTVRVCNSTANSVATASRYFAGRLEN